MEERQAYCPTCQRLVLGRRSDNSPLLLFLCCLPLAILLMLFAGFVAPPFRCPICGSETTNPDGSPTRRGATLEPRGVLILLAVLLPFVLAASYWFVRTMTRMPMDEALRRPPAARPLPHRTP